MQTTYSAGGVVLNARGQVLVTNQNGDSWSLPKGHIDPGEDARTASAREIAEETGITELEFVAPLGSYMRPRIARGGVGDDPTEMKHIEFFLYRTTQETLAPTDPHHPEARWVDLQSVAELLSHPKDKEFFISCVENISAALPKQ